MNCFENLEAKKWFSWLTNTNTRILPKLKDWKYFFVFQKVEMDGIRALDIISLLQDRIAILTGGRDRRGTLLLSFPSTPRRERAKPDDYRRLIEYLVAIPT